MPLPSFCDQSKGLLLSGQSIFSPRRLPPCTHTPLDALMVAEVAGTTVQEFAKVSTLCGRHSYWTKQVCLLKSFLIHFLSRRENKKRE